VNAKKSIFILGWDIDSGVRLLRGDDEKQNSAPSKVVDLLAWKAKENPELQIFLLRWDATIAFSAEREALPEFTWTTQTPENISIWMDTTIPVGGSHHQKIILVDDELVFTGGMDIARQRWDERSHRIHEPERTDENGGYGPYHDAQIVMDGPVTEKFAELVRWRWKNAAGYESLPIRAFDRSAKTLVPSWPQKFPPLFKDMTCAIARTIPKMEDGVEAHEIHEMFLDLIGEAEKFIYIENQFLTSVDIATALNKRLKERPELRALLVSSYNPQGIFEREGMWAGRIDFKNIVEQGIHPDRIRMVYTGISDAIGENHCKRIHSKILVVDDKYLTVSSSNITNRSMSLDTECDVSLVAEGDDQGQLILWVRNDLIGEHTGRTAEQVAKLFETDAPLEALMNQNGIHCYTFRDIDDSQFTDKGLQSVASSFADPAKPLIVIGKPVRNPRIHVLMIGILITLVLAAVIIFLKQNVSKIGPDAIKAFLESSRSSPFALPIVCAMYVVGGFILFPVTVLSLATAAVFGSILGPLYGMCGAMLSATIMFGIGRWAGIKSLRKFTGDRIKKLDYQFRETGLIGVCIIRFLPIAPFTIINMAFGISSVRFFDFFAGSFLGFLPAFIAKGIVGDSLVQIFLNPTAKTVGYLVLGITLWLAFVFGSYRLAKAWQKKRGQ
ncbi:MAG: VTT domain-containing protein, partial [Bdellovibrionota bacterium]